jgi:broad-specificity NMP kinase
MGYSGSHILELNWEQVREMLRGRGYEPVVENLWCRGL